MNTVINASNTSTELNSMKDILAQYELGLPKKGEVLMGDVISISKSNILVNLGTLGTGIIYPSEFYDNPNLIKNLKKGDSISVVLLEVENDDGYRELSLKQAQMTTTWEDIKERKDKGEVIATTIININKGGLIVEINGIQGFLPLSQLSMDHYPKIEGGDTTKIVQALQKFRGQIFNVKILDFSEEENKLIVSERAILNDQVKKELEKFTLGEVITGTVTDITDFGAFVKISDNIEGLIHISEIDWKIVENPRDYLKVSEEVSAKIISIDAGKVSLSLKALRPDPWEKIEEKLTVGQTIEGEVAKVTAYGLLVKINPVKSGRAGTPKAKFDGVNNEVMGLVPNSELAGKKETRFKPGDPLTVAIVSIDSKEHKMMLTLQGEKE
ncbi:MAG: S1 RNA-binding domain-containing protein [bacterium]|nr:S1 RNA-binding domain-containing protein [bacterium]